MTYTMEFIRLCALASGCAVLVMLAWFFVEPCVRTIPASRYQNEIRMPGNACMVLTGVFVALVLILAVASGT